MAKNWHTRVFQPGISVDRSSDDLTEITAPGGFYPAWNPLSRTD
jgi:hypothetical protein